MSVDPLTSKYPWYTPYQFAGNKPIWATDLDGLEEMPTNRGNEEHQAQTTHATVSSTKGPFSETVSKTWFWHKGSNEYGTKSGWYEGEDYKRLVWPISADLAGYADMYKTPGIGKNWSDEEKANVANTKLGQFISSGLSEKEVKRFLSQAYNVSMTQAANSSGRAEFSPINVESFIGLGQLTKGLLSQTVRSTIPSLIGVQKTSLERVIARLANLRKGDNYLVSSVEAFGSRAGSTFRGRGPLPTSDLDIMIKINSKSLNDDWVLRTLENISDDFFKETGIPLNIKSTIIKKQIGEVPTINLYKR